MTTFLNGVCGSATRRLWLQPGPAHSFCYEVSLLNICCIRVSDASCSIWFPVRRPRHFDLPRERHNRVNDLLTLSIKKANCVPEQRTRLAFGTNPYIFVIFRMEGRAPAVALPAGTGRFPPHVFGDFPTAGLSWDRARCRLREFRYQTTRVRLNFSIR